MPEETDQLIRLTAALIERYRVERELGRGGMATVYLAEDLKHHRPVALKVLRPELAAVLGAERFLSEISTTANLQHPHILPLHDSGEADGLVYYVMPFVQGESLRECLTRQHQLPVDEAVRIAIEVADALEYAHEQGVIHRDVKPENVLLHGGHALVADFGIALAARPSEGAGRLTETGMSLGTPAYMAPEQAMGQRQLTPAADIYALGTVLYEMLSGEPPFTGPTPQAIVARVMTEEPRSLTSQRHTVPAHVEAVARKALEKLPADRFASAAEFARGLQDPTFTHAPGTTGVAPAVALTRRGRAARLLPWFVAVAAALIATWMALRPRAEVPVTRYALALPPDQAPVPNRPVIPSPDGSLFLYVGPAVGGASGRGPNQLSSATQLWLRRRDRYEATPVPGTEGSWLAAFSPDGRWIAFEQDGHIRKAAVDGLTATDVADSAATIVPGIAWLEDHTIVYASGGRTLRRVSDAGGASAVVYRDTVGSVGVLTPLPGARGVLFTKYFGLRAADVWVLDQRSGAARLLIPHALMAQYLPGNRLLYVGLDRVASVVPFDPGSLRLTGEPVEVTDSVATAEYAVNNRTVYPLLAASASGTLVIRRGLAAASTRTYDLVWVDRSGTTSPIDMGGPLDINPNAGDGGWALSPDGRRLAIGLNTDAGGDIWVKDLPSGPLARITLGNNVSSFRPRWMPGARQVSFVAWVRGRAMELHRVNADGTGGEAVLARDTDQINEGAVSPDGRWAVVRVRGGLGDADRAIVGFRTGDSTPVPLIETPGHDADALTFSPDGQWIAYESNETGRREVYVRPFPDTRAGKWQVSTDGGYGPLWARSGRELFFVDVQRRLTVVPFTPGPEPAFGARRVLFRLADDLYLGQNDYYTPYDISPDGRRFVMAQLHRVEAMPFIVVDNWLSELKGMLAKR